MSHCTGEDAKLHLAKRKLNMIDADIDAHTVILNSDERSETAKQYLNLAANIAEIEREKILTKERRVEKKATKDEKAVQWASD